MSSAAWQGASPQLKDFCGGAIPLSVSDRVLVGSAGVGVGCVGHPSPGLGNCSCTPREGVHVGRGVSRHSRPHERGRSATLTHSGMHRSSHFPPIHVIVCAHVRLRVRALPLPSITSQPALVWGVSSTYATSDPCRSDCPAPSPPPSSHPCNRCMRSRGQFASILTVLTLLHVC